MKLHCFLLSLFSFFITYAQQVVKKTISSENIQVTASKGAQYLKEKLVLSEVQKGKLEEIEYSYLMARINIDKTLTGIQRKKAIEELEIAKDKQLKNVFTQDQYKRYIEFKEERRIQLQAKQKEFRSGKSNQ